jgi:hypothetical protein
MKISRCTTLHADQDFMTLGQLLFELRATQKGNGRKDGRMDGRTRVNLNAPPQ